MAIQKVEVRSLYAYDADAVSNATGLKCPEKSLTVQDQAEEADINTIVKRFGLTGQLPQNVRAPVYGDFDTVNDYQSALNAIKAAEASFMAMPADVRMRFDNDPQKFVEFCSDSANAEEMKKLGLTKEVANVKSGENAGGAAGASGEAAAGN